MNRACEVTERAYKLARKSDHRALRELFADDARWEPATKRSGKAAWNPCRDPDMIVRTLLWRAAAANRLRPAEIIDLGPHALVRLRGRRLVRLGARGFVPRLFQLIEVRDGKIVRMQDFTRIEEALGAAGHS
jgi:ketosteroid isomerase-like protein